MVLLGTYRCNSYMSACLPCCVSALHVHLCVCLCMHVPPQVSLNVQGPSHGFYQECRTHKRQNTHSLNASCKHKNHNEKPYKSQSFQPSFIGEGTFSTSMLNSIQKAFNNTHCASNLCCNANRIFKTYTSHTHANKRKLRSTEDQIKEKVLPFWLYTEPSLIMVI